MVVYTFDKRIGFLDNMVNADDRYESFKTYIGEGVKGLYNKVWIILTTQELFNPSNSSTIIRIQYTAYDLAIYLTYHGQSVTTWFWEVTEEKWLWRGELKKRDKIHSSLGIIVESWVFLSLYEYIPIPIVLIIVQFKVIENDSSDFIPTLLKTIVLPIACSYGNQVSKAYF